MKAKHRTKRIQRYRKMLGIIVLMLTITLIGVVVSATVLYKRKNACKTPDTTLVEYMMHIPKQEYEEMYAMIDLESSGYISKEDFLKRNSTIYEGIEMQNMSIKNVEYVEEDKKVTYLTSFDTVAGTISFENEAFFINGEEGYKLVWDDSMIFPNLTSADKVRVSTTQAERGEILDRNGRVLAGKGTASSVGIVPGKLENREEAIAQIAELVEITPEAIEKKLSAKWVSVEEDTAMQNHEAVETFYADYLDGRDSMVTVFEVHRDGLIGAVTFIYRKGELQTYYIGVRWKEGGVPEIQGTSVSNVAEIKLTEKGYFIYAYEYVIAHASLRQYWRIEPLPEDCQELTEKYISGLSYVNYNVLVTNWNSSNVKDILMPCMYEDIYRISTGENLKTEDWKIPAEEYERIMTTYFPVSIEQLREYCGYDEGSNSYEYEMIYASPYPPFGEVVDYTKNADGTITLIVDGVWPDYNSDLAFRNTVVVQPFEDGIFRYLSNSIEQIELELPPIARTKG